VGPKVTASYADAVFGFAEELGLSDAVHHRQDLSPTELAAWYDDADVFVCLSEHEGFCIPLLEAMHAGLPIVAFAAGAVPETLGGAGVLLDTNRPSAVASAVNRIRGDDRLTDRLRAAGHRRLEAFSPARTRDRFVEVLAPLTRTEALRS
jgi:glycosyltransferase involved in cell wall biosynthesis